MQHLIKESLIFRYLAHMYMGEALVALDRIADGIQHLNPELVTDITTTLPEQKMDQGNAKMRETLY